MEVQLQQQQQHHANGDAKFPPAYTHCTVTHIYCIVLYCMKCQRQLTPSIIPLLMSQDRNCY